MIKDLVDFGNFLLSKEREESILNKENISEVHDTDIENYLNMKENDLRHRKDI
jgi:hypothetical protein